MLIERWCTFVSSISSIMTEPPPSKYWKESIFRFTFSWGWFNSFTRDNWNSRLLAYFQCSFSFLFDTILKVSWYTSVFITSKFENSSVVYTQILIIRDTLHFMSKGIDFPFHFFVWLLEDAVSIDYTWCIFTFSHTKLISKHDWHLKYQFQFLFYFTGKHILIHFELAHFD